MKSLMIILFFIVSLFMTGCGTPYRGNPYVPDEGTRPVVGIGQADVGFGIFDRSSLKQISGEVSFCGHRAKLNEIGKYIMFLDVDSGYQLYTAEAIGYITKTDTIAVYASTKYVYTIKLDKK